MDKILIADDSAMSRMIVVRCLEMAGWRRGVVLEAKDGREAFDMALSEKPDLIIADLNMPRMGGEELLAALTADKATRDIPVLIVSSALNENREKNLLALGALGALIKPISPAGIRKALGKLFGD